LRGGDSPTARPPNHGELFGAGRGLEALYLRLLAVAQLFQDLRLLALELLALEGPLKPRLALVDEPLHFLAELAPTARGQRQGNRTVGVLEVVNVAVIEGRCLVLGRPSEDPPHGGCLAGSCRSQDEEIVPRRPHADAERRRLHRALLADHALEWWQLRRGHERQRGRVAKRPQLFRLQSETHGCIGTHSG